MVRLLVFVCVTELSGYVGDVVMVNGEGVTTNDRVLVMLMVMESAVLVPLSENVEDSVDDTDMLIVPVFSNVALFCDWDLDVESSTVVVCVSVRVNVTVPRDRVRDSVNESEGVTETCCDVLSDVESVGRDRVSLCSQE